MEIISSKEAPAAIGPYSQAVAAGSFVFISGQLGLDASGKLVSEKTEEQADAILRNMKAILNEKGLSLSSVAKTTIFLANLSDFEKVNEVYARHFGTHRPARSTVQVAALPRGAKVEIEAIAVATNKTVE
jgi:2-iminobutanoate/2-iminopropanoate deaminase